MQMVKLFRQFRCSIVAVEEVSDDHIHQYGVVAGELVKDGIYRVTDMVEKPTGIRPRRTLDHRSVHPYVQYF